MNHVPPDKVEYSYITDGIFVGTNRCCQTHFVDGLKDEGIEVDFSVEGERVDHPFGVKFFVWLPIKDRTAPQQDQLDFGVSALHKFVAMGKKVYVHCLNGHGRAPTMVAAYLVSKGMDVQVAVETIGEKRPGIHLENSQIAALNKFASRTTKNPD